MSKKPPVVHSAAVPGSGSPSGSHAERHESPGNHCINEMPNPTIVSCIILYKILIKNL